MTNFEKLYEEKAAEYEALSSEYEEFLGTPR